MTSEFKRFTVLDGAECQRVCDAIQAHRDAWTHRIPDIPFYTLGAASYLDAANGYAHYSQAANRIRPLLQTSFGWLHDRIAVILEQHFNQPVSYQHPHALPGFHIFLAHPAFTQALAAVHWDAQQLLIQWPPQTDFSKPVSFTLSVALPKHGAGLRYWDFEWQKNLAIGREAVEEVVSRLPSQYLEYAVGEMVVHSGRLLHQIAPANHYDPSDKRITLQGHALFSEGEWKLYW